MKVLSYGGGLDSWAMLLDAVLVRGEKPFCCKDCGWQWAAAEG